VVCGASDNKCMYSCGKTAELRKMDLKQLIANGTADEASICVISGTKSYKSSGNNSIRKLELKYYKLKR